MNWVEEKLEFAFRAPGINLPKSEMHAPTPGSAQAQAWDELAEVTPADPDDEGPRH